MFFFFLIVVFDANGKKEAGMHGGNTVFEGDYYQCMSIQASGLDPNSSSGLYCITYWLKEASHSSVLVNWFIED